MDQHSPPSSKPRMITNNMPATTISRPAPTTRMNAPRQHPGTKEGRNYMDIDEFFKKVGGDTSPKSKNYLTKFSNMVPPLLNASDTSSAARSQGQVLQNASQEEKLKLLSALYRKNDYLESRRRHASPHERRMYYEHDEVSRSEESLKRRYDEHERSLTQIYRRNPNDSRYIVMPPLTKISKGRDDSDLILQRKIERKLKDSKKDSRQDTVEPYIDVLGDQHESEIGDKQSTLYQRTNSLDRLVKLEEKVASTNHRPPKIDHRPKSADILRKDTESRSQSKSRERTDEEECIPKENEPSDQKDAIVDSLLMERLWKNEQQKLSSGVTTNEKPVKSPVSDITGGTANSSFDESSRHYDSSHDSDSSGKSEVYDESYQMKTQAAHGLISLNSGGVATNTNGANASDDSGGAAKVKKRGGGKPGRRRKRGYIYDPKPLVPKSKINNLPAELKDEEYWTRRQRNNEAAKRSRENRRVKELEMMTLVKDLTGTNTELRTRIQELEVRNKFLEQILGRHPAGLDGSGGSNASSSDLS
eukprot:TCONS_00065044-protein